jgi:Translation initiation factor 2, beta subunit (eIF-2beta)/eIF-5 N-terminal domain
MREYLTFLAEKSKLVIKPPQVMKLRGRRTAWLNFVEICNQMKRQPEHVCAFICAELGGEGAINGEQLSIFHDHKILISSS